MDPKFKKRIDAMDQEALEEAYPELKTLISMAHVNPFAQLFKSETERANDHYLLDRYFLLDSQKILSWRDPAFQTKYDYYIIEEGIDPFTGKPATKEEIKRAKDIKKVRAFTESLQLASTLYTSYVGYNQYYNKPYTTFSDVFSKVKGKIPVFNRKPVIPEVNTKVEIIEQILKKDLRPYTGDLMDPIESKRYSDYWRGKGMGSEETWQAFKKNIPNGTIDDYNKILYEQNPWPLNVKPSFKILKGGDTFEMAMSPRSKQLDTWPGNFATDINTISDSQYVRDRLAVKYNWKPDIDRVVQYRVKEGSEIPANVGPIGPQIDLEINRYLPGGPNQIEMLMGREKMNYLEIIGIRNIE